MIADRWGVDAAEVERRYPCDDFVGTPRLQLWRAVTVHTSAARLWPWVAQIRCAPYSYDWIDNGGRRSPQKLLGPAPLKPGDQFTSTAGRPQGRLMSVAPQVHYTGRIMGAFMSYVLVPVDDRITRLLLKVVMNDVRWLAPLVSVGDLVMARRQLLNLKRLAETHPEWVEGR